MPLSILVIGMENPRIGDLFREVGRFAKVSHMNIGPMPRKRLELSDSVADSICSSIVNQFGKPDVIVFTWPQFSILAEKLSWATRVYYCKDPFEYWTIWDRQEIHDLESRMLSHCQAVFAVSRSLVEDFRPRTRGRVFYLPNGVEESFVNAPPLPRPPNLPADKPVLGNVGQVNATYDWQFIDDLATNLPEARICFVGNHSEDNVDLLREIKHRLANTPNIVFLDRQPHDQLPAFIQHLDISMCFVRADEYGHRRSPLRLYDYLTAKKAVISTPIREAFEHLPHLHIAATGKEAAELARRILAGEIAVDVAARKNYIAQQTWAMRAGQLLRELVPTLKTG
jgi:glycosyltransferase involved in cell wall biosynthesis